MHGPGVRTRPAGTRSSRSTVTRAPSCASTSRTSRRAGTTSSTRGPTRTSIPFADLQAPTAYRNWDSERRLKETESQGVVAEVLFPNTVPPFFAQGNLTALEPTAADYERRWAGLQAHNRWVADFCAAAPGRRAGLAQIFLNDVDDALAEVRWAKDNMRRVRRDPPAERSAELRGPAAVGSRATSRSGTCAKSSTSCSTCTAAAASPTSASTRRRGRSC